MCDMTGGVGTLVITLGGGGFGGDFDQVVGTGGDVNLIAPGDTGCRGIAAALAMSVLDILE